jgi:hypothetical protein
MSLFKPTNFINTYSPYELNCSYCGKKLMDLDDLDNLIMEDTDYKIKGACQLFCNHDCLLKWRLNGNLSERNSGGSYYLKSSRTLMEKLDQLQEKQEEIRYGRSKNS